jgi:hypothetical protein
MNEKSPLACGLAGLKWSSGDSSRSREMEAVAALAAAVHLHGQFSFMRLRGPMAAIVCACYALDKLCLAKPMKTN